MGTASIQQIELTPTSSLAILIDKNKFLDLAKECVDAIASTHPAFKFTDELYCLFEQKRFLLSLSYIRQNHSTQYLVVPVNWNELEHICFFVENMPPFPNWLSPKQRLDVQKIIITAIWEKWKGI